LKLAEMREERKKNRKKQMRKSGQMRAEKREKYLLQFLSLTRNVANFEGYNLKIL